MQIINPKIFEVSEQEVNLIKFLRDLGYGNVEVTVQDGRPILIKQAIKSVKL